MKSQERDRFEAAMANPSIVKLTNEKTGRYDHFYTLTLGPGQVRHLDAFDFFGASVESLIETLHAASSKVEVSSVPTKIYNFHGGGHQMGDFETQGLDSLLKGANWEERLRVHHALGRLWMQEGMPTGVYVLFHRRLELGRHFAIAECLEAWVPDSAKRTLADSYRSSPEHLYVAERWDNFAVFARTAFVRERLEIIAEAERRRVEADAVETERLRMDEDARRASAEAERLRRSRFATFVYIMEDTRKSVFKIGRSKTPGKRERTLQSEVPETALRFSIPAEEAHEKELHERFSHRRIRGEWFELTEEDLVEALTFLKANGDAERANADIHWLGTLFLRAR